MEYLMSAIDEAPMKYRKAHDILCKYAMNEKITEYREYRAAMITALNALNKLAIAEGTSHGKPYSISYEGIIELQANSLSDAMVKVVDRLGFIVPHNTLSIVDGERKY